MVAALLFASAITENEVMYMPNAMHAKPSPSRAMRRRPPMNMSDHTQPKKPLTFVLSPLKRPKLFIKRQTERNLALDPDHHSLLPRRSRRLLLARVFIKPSSRYCTGSSKSFSGISGICLPHATALRPPRRGRVTVAPRSCFFFKLDLGSFDGCGFAAGGLAG